MADKLNATDDRELFEIEGSGMVEDPESPSEAPEEQTEVTPSEEAPSAPPSPRSVLVKDAKSRSLRTGFQTALGAAFAAVLLVCATYLKDGDFSHLDYKAFAIAAATAGLPPIVAFMQRMLEG